MVMAEKVLIEHSFPFGVPKEIRSIISSNIETIRVNNLKQLAGKSVNNGMASAKVSLRRQLEIKKKNWWSCLWEKDIIGNSPGLAVWGGALW